MQNKKEQLDILLVKVKLLLDKIGVPFILSRGTLLGLVRDEQLIPWDDDVDILSTVDIRDKIIRDRIGNVFDMAGFGVSLRDKNFEWGEEEAFHFAFSARVDNDIPIYVGMKFIKNNEGVMRETNVPVKYPIGTFQPFKQIVYQGEYYCIPQKPEWLFNRWYGNNWDTRARSTFIIKDDRTEEILIHPDQSKAWKMPTCEEVYLQCDKEGNFIKPYKKIANNIRSRDEDPNIER